MISVLLKAPLEPGVVVSFTILSAHDCWLLMLLCGVAFSRGTLTLHCFPRPSAYISRSCHWYILGALRRIMLRPGPAFEVGPAPWEPSTSLAVLRAWSLVGSPMPLLGS